MNTLIKTMANALVVSSLSVVGLAYADPAVQMPSFDQVDKNKDGVIEKSEAKAVKSLDFATADIDRDGKLNENEYKAAKLEKGQEGGAIGGSAPSTYNQ